MKLLFFCALLCAACFSSAQTGASFTVVKGGFIAHGISGDGNTLIGEAKGVAAKWDPFHGTKSLTSIAGTWATDASSDGAVVIGRSQNETYIWRLGNYQVWGGRYPLGISNDGHHYGMYGPIDSRVTAIWGEVGTNYEKGLDYKTDSGTVLTGEGTKLIVKGVYGYSPLQTAIWDAYWYNVFGVAAAEDDVLASNYDGGRLYGNHYVYNEKSQMYETHWWDFSRARDIANLGSYSERHLIPVMISDDDYLGASPDKIYCVAFNLVQPLSDVLALNGITPGLTNMQIVGISSDAKVFAGTGYSGTTLVSWRFRMAPNGRSDVYQVVPNNTLNVAAPGVLANDQYSFGGTVLLDQAPQHGTVMLQQDGSFSYTPDHNYLGRDTFTYRITKDPNTGNPITVVLKIGVPSNITLGATEVAGGAKVSGRVVLNFTAFAPVNVALKASKPSVVSMPSSVTVAAGQKSATFVLTTITPPSTTSTSISATLNEVSVSTSLTVAASSPKSLILDPAEVRGGAEASGHVTLWKPALSGGAEMKFSSSNTAVATVPGGYTVPVGQQAFDFPITTVQVASATPATIAVTGNGSTATAVLTVRTATMLSISLSNSTVASGGTLTLTVNMDAAPSTYGYRIDVSDGNTYHVRNSSVANVTYHAPITDHTISVEVAVTGEDGKQLTQTIQVTPTVLTALSISAPKVTSGSQTTVKGIYDGVPENNQNLALTSSNPAVVSVPSSVAPSDAAPLKTFGVDADTIVTIKGVYKGVTKTAKITVVPGVLSGLALNPTSVKGGFNSIGTVSLTGPAGPNDSVVDLASNNTSFATVPATVTVTYGHRSAQFTIVTKSVTATKTVTITVSRGGKTASKTLTITP